MTNQTKLKDAVIVNVRGGVAMVVQKPFGVTVILRDYDGRSETEPYEEEIITLDEVISCE